MQSLEVSKSCDNPIVEDTCNEIESAFAKAATLLETRRNILQRKKNITVKMEVSLNITENSRPILVNVESVHCLCKKNLFYININ